MRQYRVTDRGERGPHPDITSLKHWMVIIRAQTMKGEARDQAMEELSRRGLWL